MTANVAIQGVNHQSLIFFPDAVGYDWDNTLVWSWNDVCQAMTHVRAKYGLPKMPRKEIERIFCRRSTRELFPTPEWFGPENGPQAYIDYNVYLKQARAENGIIPLDGALPLIEFFWERGVPQFVVSNKNGDALRGEAQMVGKKGEEADWSHYFAAIVGAGDAKRPDGEVRDKPARESVDLALHRAGLKPGLRNYFIGDSISDVKCANNSGCTPILLGTEEDAETIRNQDNQKVEIVVPDFHVLLQKLRKCAAQPVPAGMVKGKPGFVQNDCV
jgi:phosphoglycolate phosphatase